jgi:hypothetical protein
MAKLKGLDKDIDKLRIDILNSIERSKFNERLAKDVAAEIRKNGIEPELETPTKQFRNRVVSRKGPGYFVGKSSLTLSGQLLGALRSFFNRKKSRFGFFVQTGIHKDYRVKGKKKIYKTGGGTKLKDIFEGVSKLRPVTKVFDRPEFKAKTERKLVAAIKRYFRKS